MTDVPDYVNSPSEKAETKPIPAPWETQNLAPSPPSPPSPTKNESTPASGIPAFIQGTGVDQNMDDPNALSGGQGGQRLWIPKGGTKNLIFLTEGNGPLPYGPPLIFEHNFPLGVGKKRFQNWLPCIEPLGVTCGLCEWANTHDGSGRRYKGMYFTVLDLSQWTDKQGNVHKMSKKLMVAKKDTKEKLERRYLTRLEAGSCLRGALFRATRGSSDKSPSVGDDFEFVQMVDLRQIPEEFREPIDYIEFLGLNKTEELKKRVADAVQRMRVETGEFGGSKNSGTLGAGLDVAY